MGEHYFFLNFTFNENEKGGKRTKMDFTTNFPKEFNLKHVDEQNNPIRWQIALTDFMISSKVEESEEEMTERGERGETEDGKSVLILNKFPYLVMSDLVGESYLRGRFSPILRIFYPELNEATTPFILPYYFPLNTNRFNSIRLHFYKEEDLTPLYAIGEVKVSCTLHLLQSRV